MKGGRADARSRERDGWREEVMGKGWMEGDGEGRRKERAEREGGRDDGQRGLREGWME